MGRKSTLKENEITAVRYELPLLKKIDKEAKQKGVTRSEMLRIIAAERYMNKK